MPSLRDPFFAPNTVSLDEMERLQNSDMGSLRRMYEAGRIGTERNALGIDELAARSAGDLQRAQTLRAQNDALGQRQGMYAEGVTQKVEDIDWDLGRGLNWFGGTVGQAGASMVEPVAATTALGAVGRVAGMLPGAAGKVGRAIGTVGGPLTAYGINQRQMAGEFANNAMQDEELMARTSPQDLYRTANVVGGVAGAADTVLPGIIGRQVTGAGLRAGMKAMGAGMGPAAKTGLGMLGEGTTELSQGEVGRYALGHLNPNRDTSEDNSNRLNEFAGGMFGSGPMVAAGAYTDAGYRRLGQTAETVGTKAGDVYDLAKEKYVGSALEDGVNAAGNKAKDLFNAGRGKVVDLQEAARDEDGEINLGKVMDLAGQEAQRTVDEFLGADAPKSTRSTLDPETRNLLDEKAFTASLDAGAPPAIVNHPDPQVYAGWRAEQNNARNAKIMELLEDRAEAGDAQANALADRVATGDQVAATEAALYLAEAADRDEVQTKANAFHAAAGKLAGMGTRAVGRGAVKAGKAIVGAAKDMWSAGKDEYNKKNAQGEDSAMGAAFKDAYTAWRERTGADERQASNAATPKTTLSLSEMAKSNKERKALRAEKWRRIGLLGETLVAEAQGENAAVQEYVRSAGFKMAELAEAWNNSEKAEGTGLGNLAVPLYDIAKTMRVVYGARAPGVVQQMREVMGTEAGPLFDRLAEHVESAGTPYGRAAAAAERKRVANQMMALVPPDQVARMQAHGGDYREQFLSAIEAIGDGRAGPGTRKAFEAALGKDVLKRLLNSLYNPNAEEPKAKESSMFGDSPDTGTDDDYEARDAEKSVEAGSGEALYGFSGMTSFRGGNRRTDPFAADLPDRTQSKLGAEDEALQRKADGERATHLGKRRPHLFSKNALHASYTPEKMLELMAEEGKGTGSDERKAKLREAYAKARDLMKQGDEASQQKLQGMTSEFFLQRSLDSKIKALEKHLQVDQTPERALAILKKEAERVNSEDEKAEMRRQYATIRDLAGKDDAASKKELHEELKSFFVNRAGDYRVSAKSALELMKKGKYQPTKILALYRDYLRQEGNSAEAGRVSKAILDANEKPGNQRRLSSTDEEHEQIIAAITKDAEKFFGERFVVVAERLSDRIPDKMGTGEVLDLVKDAKKALDDIDGAVRKELIAQGLDPAKDSAEFKARRDEMISEGNFIFFTTADKTAPKKGDAPVHQRLPMKIGQLVGWTKAQAKQYGKDAPNETGKKDDFKNVSKDEEFLAHLLSGIESVMRSGYVLAKTHPYMYDKFGRVESFKDGIPSSLQLATTTQFQRERVREEKLAGIDPQSVPFGPALKNDPKKNATLDDENQEEVIKDQAKNEEYFVADPWEGEEEHVEISPFRYKTLTSKEIGGLKGKTPKEAEKYLAALAANRGRKVEKEILAGDTTWLSPSARRALAAVSGDGRDALLKELAASEGARTAQQFLDDAALTASGPTKDAAFSTYAPEDPKTDRADKTPLDFFGKQKEGEAPDEFADAMFRTKHGGKSTYDPLPFETVTDAARKAEDRAGPILQALRGKIGTPEQGLNQIIQRIKAAETPYTKDGPAGGIQYLYPAAHALNPDVGPALVSFDKSMEGISEHLDMLRGQAFRVLRDKDVAPKHKVAIARLLLGDKYGVTLANVKNVIDEYAARNAEAGLDYFPDTRVPEHKDITKKELTPTARQDGKTEGKREHDPAHQPAFPGEHTRTRKHAEEFKGDVDEMNAAIERKGGQLQATKLQTVANLAQKARDSAKADATKVVAWFDADNSPGVVQRLGDRAGLEYEDYQRMKSGETIETPYGTFSAVRNADGTATRVTQTQAQRDSAKAAPEVAATKAPKSQGAQSGVAEGRDLGSIPMYYKMPAQAVRQELRAQYPNGTTTAQLMADGHRTATTRKAFGGVGDTFTVNGIKYRITALEKVDLGTAAGRAKWSQREGWDVDYVQRNLSGQVYTGALQTVFERVGGAQETSGADNRLTITAHQSSGYRERTKHNADSAGLTVAIAANYTTAGERLTKSVAGDKYLAIPLDVAPDKGGVRLAKAMRQLDTTTLNVAGNGIYTLAPTGHTQASVNQHVYDLIAAAHALRPITKIETGGQTGVDLAGAVAAYKLGIPAVVTLPKGFVQRDASGKDSQHTAADIERQIVDGAAALGLWSDTGARKLNAMSTKIHNDLQRPGFAATHDSPIRHEGKFDWRSHQGKGEGNAAFGAGTYLSTADGVHRSYKDQFTAEIAQGLPKPTWFGHFVIDPNGADPGMDRVEGVILEIENIPGVSQEIADAIRGMFDACIPVVESVVGGRTRLEYADPSLMKPFPKGIVDEIGKLHKGAARWMGEFNTTLAARRTPKNPGGKSPTYEVSVNIKPEELLDWDKPLNEQSSYVKERVTQAERDLGTEFSGAMGAWPYGEDIYKDLAEHLGSQTKASDYLQSLGILGHKYAASGGKNDTHPNYVIYDDSKITTNYVHFNAQAEPMAGWKAGPTAKAMGAPASDREMAQAQTYVNKVLGPKFKLMFEKDMGHSGEFIEAENLIKIAIGAAAGTMPTAYHEALHAFFASYLKSDPRAMEVMKSLAENQTILDRITALLDGYPAAQAQLTSGEERLAYIFQFYAAGQLDLPSGKGRNWVQKLARYFRKVLGTLRADERATDILDAFHDGKFSDPSTAQRVLAKLSTPNSLSVKARRNLDGLIQGAAAAALPAQAILNDSPSRTAKRLMRTFYANPGSERDGKGGEGYLNAVKSERTRRNNAIMAALEEGGATERDMKAIVTYLQQGVDPIAEAGKIPYAPHRKAVAKIRAELEDFHHYMTSKGLDIGYIQDYFPVIWDSEALAKNPTKFAKMLVENYPEQMGKAIDGTNLTPMEAAMHLATLLIDRAVFDGKLAPGREDGVLIPFFESSENRTLDWIKPEHREPWLSKELLPTLTKYFGQGVRAAEYVERFGEKGEKLDHALKLIDQELSAEGAKMVKAGKLKDAEAGNKWAARQYRDVRMAIGAMEGTLGKNISDTHRSITSWVVVYQNIRLLPLSLFASVVDPLSIVARGGDFKLAGEVFINGMKEVFKGWREVLGTLPPDQQKNEWEQMAEFIGATESAMMAHHVSEEYSSQYMSPRAKKINDMMFKLNGMESWNRAMRVGATKGAAQFLIKHKDLPDAQHSKRWLKELGLTPEDIIVDNGKLVVNKHELATLRGISLEEADAKTRKVQFAMNRWIEGAVLTPNSAQRPAWSSDPRWSFIFHLKQFTYSFQQTILTRAWNEMKQGNLAPMGSLSLFIPAMIASDMTKGLIVGGGELPPYMQGYNAADWFGHGLERAGTLGYGQLALDAVQDPASLGGPMAEQIVDGFRQPLMDTAVKALPANAIYKNAVL